MRLYEIIKVGITDVGKINTTPEKLKQMEPVATTMGLPTYHFKDEDVDNFCVLSPDDIIVAWTRGFTYNYAPDNIAYVAKNSLVDANHRNRGLMTGLYDTINTKLGFSIMSDFEQTHDAIGLWRSIFKRHSGRMKKFNKDTGLISKIGTFDEVYDDPNAVFLLENSEFTKRLNENNNHLQLTDNAKYPCEGYFGLP